MLPLGHLAFAYLLYVAFVSLRSRSLPTSWALLPVTIGSQFPDIVDKPLDYWGVLYSGRSAAHSLFTFTLVCGGLWFLSIGLRETWTESDWRDKLRKVAPAAFAVAYGSHIIGDVYKPLLAGDFSEVRFLLYPIYRPEESTIIGDAASSTADSAIPPWIVLLNTYQDMETHPQLELILLAMAVFICLRYRAWRTKARSTQ